MSAQLLLLCILEYLKAFPVQPNPGQEYSEVSFYCSTTDCPFSLLVSSDISSSSRQRAMCLSLPGGSVLNFSLHLLVSFTTVLCTTRLLFRLAELVMVVALARQVAYTGLSKW